VVKERNPDTLPTMSDPSGPCPWCNNRSNFRFEGVTNLYLEYDTEGALVDSRHMAPLTCLGCERTCVVIVDKQGRGIHWYPAPGAGHLDPAVDPPVAPCYDEGMRCLGIGANRAAAVMFRSALHLFVKDRGNEKAKEERFLKPALKQMKDDHSLPPSLWNWADHLNQIGNEGAHPEDYDEVTAEEATGLGKFVRHLITLEYELPAQLLRDQGLAPAVPSQGQVPKLPPSSGIPMAF
jgi:hypothetical protein